MSLSRWKLMAGVLGVSIGGLAAAASQCPKFDKSKGRTPEAPVAKADTKLPPAGAPSAPALPDFPAIPAPSAAPAIPAAPQLTPAGATTPAIPPAPSAELPKPADVTPPALPPIPAPSKPTEPAKPATTPPAPLIDLVPPAQTKPAETKPSTPVVPPVTFDATPPSKPTTTKPPAFELTPPATTGTAPKPLVPVGGTQPSTPGAPVASPPNTTPPAPPVGLPDFPPAPPMRAEVPPPPPMRAEVPPTPPAPAATESKFRILLRVGDGEPMFEVKNGDNLVLKVSCEKVDIKSPEKGGGLSEVTARGKVRFAGFGAEGTCDELKFMAGTGEVQMTGDVKVQVKDKLGRVESELSTTTMKYKIDASSVGGAIKP